MATLELVLKVRGQEDILAGEAPIETGIAAIGTTKQQRELAIDLLRRMATKLEEDTMKKFGTGQVIPEPDDAPVKDWSDEDSEELAKESEKGDQG